MSNTDYAAHDVASFPLVFMGTPAFAVPALEGLFDAGYPILGVFTQKSKPKGRGLRAQKSPVQIAAERLGLCVDTPDHLNTHAFDMLKKLSPRCIVVAAYGLLLPPPVLALPQYGCLNLHASLLPRWRGAAPVQRALIAGDVETGITLMQMDRGMDTGHMFLKKPLAIQRDDNSETLLTKLATLAKDCIVSGLPLVLEKRIKARPQPENGVTYASKITSKEAQIFWDQEAVALERLIRGLYPKAFFYHNGKRFRVLKACVDKAPFAAKHGFILDDELLIACGKGALRLQRLQAEGRTAVDAKAFLNGHKGFFRAGGFLSLDARIAQPHRKTASSTLI